MTPAPPRMAPPGSRVLTPAGFAREASGGRFQIPPHIALLNRKLVDLAARRVRGLVVELPPRHGKSTLASQYFPAWYLGMFPDHRVVLGSYEERFAATWGRKAQDVLLEHGARTFGVEVDPNATAATDWGVKGHAGGMFCCGAGGPVTGRGADLLILDDLVKNAEEAMSESNRRRNADWLESTAFTRLEPDAVVLLMHTRWHEEDPCGLVLSGQVGEHIAWEELKLPALAEADDPLGRAPGEALWPERYPREQLEAIRAGSEKNVKSSSLWFECLYQQTPTPKSGGMFQHDWFADNLVSAVPADCERVRCWDRAASHGKGDYTVGVLMAHDGKSWYVEDVRRGQWSEGERDATIRETAIQDRLHHGEVPVRAEQEPGSAGKDAAAAFVRNLAGFDAGSETSTGSKEARARAFAAQCEYGNVKVRKAPWTDAFIRELVGFPRGKHDDMVDAASMSFNYLAMGGSEWDSAVAGPRRGFR